jgi:phospholipid/cholesterol/gamma-HCH transport system substrate-binding protein
MSAKPNDFKLGLFVLFAILILLAALFVFGVSRLFKGHTVEETYVADTVSGLKVGAPVLLRGVPVGEVTRINFSWNIYHQQEPRYVVVVFEVNDDVSPVRPGKSYARLIQQEVAKGLRARIKSQGLAGATILSLEYVNPSDYPTLRVPWTPHHVYIPSAPGEFSQIISSLTAISSNLKAVDFRELESQARRDLQAVGRLVDHFNQADIEGLSANLNGLVSDLRGVSARLQGFVGQTNAPTRVDLQAISMRADELLGNLKTTTARLDRMLGNVDESSLNQSLDNIRRATLELSEAIHQFKEYPSGTLLGPPPPRARSVEAP